MTGRMRELIGFIGATETPEWVARELLLLADEIDGQMSLCQADLKAAEADYIKADQAAAELRLAMRRIRDAAKVILGEAAQ